VVRDLLNEVVKHLLPNKTLQHVKRYLRREARKPVDMSAKQHIMHIYRINTEEITRCPPAFDRSQCLSDDEIINILLWGTPKSWQRQMDRQGFDPLAKTLTEVAEFMECIKMSEDFDGDRKVAAVTKKGNNKTKANNKGSLGPDGSKHCMLHGNNNTHDTLECKTLMAQAKKLKGNNGAKFLKVDLRFLDEIIEWDGSEMPFKDGDASTKEAYYCTALKATGLLTCL